MYAQTRVSDAELATALAVPGELQQLKALELPEHIELISEDLLDYATARFLADDPRFESRDAWDALRSATDAAADYSFALHTPAGEVARIWIDYVGLGFGFEVQAGERRPLSAAWIQAFHLALIVRNERTLLKLYKAVHVLPEGSEAAYARALACRWASTHGIATKGIVPVEATDGSTALLHALFETIMRASTSGWSRCSDDTGCLRETASVNGSRGARWRWRRSLTMAA